MAGKQQFSTCIVLLPLPYILLRVRASLSSDFQYLQWLQSQSLGRFCAGVSYSNDLYSGLEEDLDDSYHTDDDHHEAGQTTTFAVSSSLYTPLSTREPAKLPARPLSRLGTPRSLAQQYVSM